MTSTHRFKDEWLLRAVEGLPPGAVEALRERAKPYLATALIEAGHATRESLGAAVKKTFKLELVSPAAENLEKMALALVPEKLCRRHRLIPIRLQGEAIEVAMENPLDLSALNDVEVVTGRRPAPFYCLPDRFEGLLGEVYNPDAVIFDLLNKFQENSTVEVLEGDSTDAAADATVGTPVIKLINSMISKALKQRASDIHIEHEEHNTGVRFRVDGSLKTIMTLPRYVGAGPVVSRIKIMGNLDIADRLRPQDGRAKLRVDAMEIGLRISTLPTKNGEKVVIRILDNRAAEISFEQLGFRPEIASRIEKILTAAQGLFLVTGPTGSGKTTTLYSILHKLKGEDTNIVTVEDPIEYKLQGINQVQVQEKQGLTFAAVLRSVLRQDPDVILVGEIRDAETADIAIQAALTGHLVLATLHTNGTLATLSRLLDMGVERFKLAPGLIGVTAQRLVRRLCAACREAVPEAELDPALARDLKDHGLEPKAWKAKGCAKCDFLGYRGRIPLIELLVVGPELRERINAGDDSAALRRKAMELDSFCSLLADGLWRIAKGDTTLDELRPYAALGSDADGGESKAPAAPAAAAPSAAAPAEPKSAPSGPRTVLVADDDPTIRIILKKTLEAQGYQVTEAADGVQALGLVAACDPEMLVVDLQMPGLDGHGVIRGVRSGLGLARTLIIMLTSASDDKSQLDALALGADDYVIKPVKPQLLSARINAAFRRRDA